MTGWFMPAENSDKAHTSILVDCTASVRNAQMRSLNGLRPRSRATARSITWDENLHIVFATQSGIVKKSNLSDYANVRRGGIIAIQIEDGDCLIDAKLTNGNNEIVLITTKGMSLRFHGRRPDRRAAGGVGPGRTSGRV